MELTLDLLNPTRDSTVSARSPVPRGSRNLARQRAPLSLGLFMPNCSNSPSISTYNIRLDVSISPVDPAGEIPANRALFARLSGETRKLKTHWWSNMNSNSKATL
jgi:hypothetical protein